MAGRSWQYGGALLLVQLLVGCGGAGRDDGPPANAVEASSRPAAATAVGAGQPAAEDVRLVLAFGDSLYAGYHLDEGKGFAPALERALAGSGVKAKVVNAGVSGDTSAAGRERLAFTLDGLSRKPDLVLVGLGGNDMLRGIDPQQTRANLDAILSMLKDRNIPAMLTGMRAAPNLGPDYVAAFDAIHPALAKAYDVPLYPFFLDGVLGRRQMMLPDSIHPNADGVAQIASRVAPLVAKRLSDAG